MDRPIGLYLFYSFIPYIFCLIRSTCLIGFYVNVLRVYPFLLVTLTCEVQNKDPSLYVLRHRPFSVLVYVGHVCDCVFYAVATPRGLSEARIDHWATNQIKPDLPLRTKNKGFIFRIKEIIAI